MVGAGALGSTEILLRSQAIGKLPLSKKLGANFSGNGDMLGFGFNGPKRVNSVGEGERHGTRSKDPPGPCIASVIDARVPLMTDEKKAELEKDDVRRFIVALFL